MVSRANGKNLAISKLLVRIQVIRKNKAKTHRRILLLIKGH